jgi:O-antigen/teichoic acid export membrane protein
LIQVGKNAAPIGDDGSPPPAGLPDAERVRIIRSGLINYVGPLASSVLGLVAIPLLLRSLGLHSYGLWIAVVSMVATIGAIDFGTGSALLRAVAGASTPGERAAIAPFVVGTWKAFGWIALGGALGIVVVGAVSAQVAGLTPELRREAYFAWSAGAALAIGQTAMARATYMLQGLHRFDSANVLSVLLSVLRVGGSVPLALGGFGLAAVAWWQAAVTIAVAVAAERAVARIEPEFRLRRMPFPWVKLRELAGFSLGSQAVQVALAFVSESALPLFAGAVMGPAAIVSLSVGQKFPSAVGQLASSSAQVFYPAAASHADSPEGMRGFLALSTRWLALLTLGPCLVLAVIAPAILQVWIGRSTPATVTIFRLMAATIFIGSLLEGSLNAMWGTGDTAGVLRIVLLFGMPATLLAIPLMLLIGIAGAGWAFLACTTAMTIAFVRKASGAYGLDPWRLIRESLGGLAWPVGATLVVTVALDAAVRPSSWVGVAAIAICGGLVYVGVLVRVGLRPDEITIVRALLGRRGRDTGR